MENIKKRTIIICIFFLGVISISTLFNARYISNGYSSYFYKQIVWFLIGFILLKYRKQYRQILNNKLIFYLNNLLLLYVLFFGKSINGAKAWINIGFFSLQPSEFIKILLPINYFNILSSHRSKTIKLLTGTIYFFIPTLLVFLEPDTGAVIFYFIEYLIFLFYLKFNNKFYLSIAVLTLSLIITTVYLYKYSLNFLVRIFGTKIFYRIDRMLNFKTNYQLDLSLTAIFSSSFFNYELKPSILYIPEFTTDFIFAFITKSYGLFSSLIILITYLTIINNIINLIGDNKKTNYLIISFLAIFFLQTTINICMNIGLIPIIGINLPFLSYGGSNILMYFIFLSIIF